MKKASCREKLITAIIYIALASLVAQTVKHLPAMQETRVQSLGWEDPLKKEMTAHFSILAWKIPWTAEPGRLLSMGSQRVRHDWATSLHLWIGFPGGSDGKEVQKTWVQSLGWKDPLEKIMATHSSILWTDYSLGLQRVKQEYITGQLTFSPVNGCNIEINIFPP